MKVQMVISKVKSESVPDIEAAGMRVFAALEREQPQGFRYTSCRLPDGVTYVNLLAVEEGMKNPLLDLPEGREFQKGLKGWLADSPASEPLAVIGTYRFFEDAREP